MKQNYIDRLDELLIELLYGEGLTEQEYEEYNKLINPEIDD